MAPPFPWRIEQINGTRAPIVLSGYSAPFGRPRKGAVVEEEYSLREAEVYYPGFGPPTRHIFGDKHEPIVLKGRWMDRVLGTGGANAMVSGVKLFLKDALPVRITWGNISAYTGLFHSVKIGRESIAEVTWEMRFRIDSDDTQPVTTIPTPKPDPADQVNAVTTLQAGFSTPSVSAPGDIVFPVGFFDAIDTLTGNIANFTSTFVNAADQISDLEQATSAQLGRLQGAIGQLQTAYATLATTLDSAAADFGVNVASADSQSQWAQQRESNEALILAILVLLSQLSLQAEIAQRSQVKQVARAQQGDTWEALSTRHYGTIAKADTLRQANLSRYGTKPTPGRNISIPKA